MRRWVFSCAAALSLLLCLATLVLWVRSYWVFDVWTRTVVTGTDEFISVSGRAIYFRYRDKRFVNPDPGWDVQTVPPDSPAGRQLSRYHLAVFKGATLARNLGFALSYTNMLDASAPYWSIAALTAVLPIARLAAILSWRRRIGHCPKCGYDLTANTSGKCPECGTPIPSSAATPETESPRPA